MLGGHSYIIEKQTVTVYDRSELEVEVYVPTKPITLDAPEVGCSPLRYKKILIQGARETQLYE